MSSNEGLNTLTGKTAKSPASNPMTNPNETPLVSEAENNNMDAAVENMQDVIFDTLHECDSLSDLLDTNDCHEISLKLADPVIKAAAKVRGDGWCYDMSKLVEGNEYLICTEDKMYHISYYGVQKKWYVDVPDGSAIIQREVIAFMDLPDLPTPPQPAEEE